MSRRPHTPHEVFHLLNEVSNRLLAAIMRLDQPARERAGASAQSSEWRDARGEKPP